MKPPPGGRPRVLVTLPGAISGLEPDLEVIRGRVGDWVDAEGLLIGPTDVVGAEAIGQMPNLRVVAVAGGGVDAVDASMLADRGIRLVSAPEATVIPTATLTVCLMLMVARGVPRAMDQLAHDEWSGWAFDYVVGRDLDGLTLGLVGFGRIGRQVERLAKPFGMQVLHHCRTPTGLSGYRESLCELLRESDVVSLHVPLLPSTRGLIGRDEIGEMRPGAALINTSRGGVLDEDALVDALVEGRLSGAGLDVFQSEPRRPDSLLVAPNLVLTPHIGTATRGARDAMMRDAARMLVEALAESE